METQSWQPPVLLSRKHPSSASTVVSRKRIGSPSRTRVAVDAHDFAVENCHCALVERKSLYDTGRAWVIVEEHRERYIRNRVLNQLRMQGEEIGCFGRLMNAVVNGRDSVATRVTHPSFGGCCGPKALHKGVNSYHPRGQLRYSERVAVPILSIE